MAQRSLSLLMRIQADTKKAQGDIKKIRKELRAAGKSGKQAGRDIRGFGTGLDGVQRSAVTLRRTLAALGAVALFRTAIRNTIRQEQALAQVEARINSTGSAAGFTTQQLADVAAELQKITTFGDEAILELQSVLLTFTPIQGEIFERTTEAALNLSTALGQDLRSSALQLGKVLSDPVSRLGELSRMGIILTDSQKALVRQLVETGDLAGAQAVILDELEVEFGGAARAARDTFGGALQSLGNAFGDLLESKGGLEDARQSIEALTDLLQDPAIGQGVNNIISQTARGAGALARLTSDIVNSIQDLGRVAALEFGDLDELTEIEARIDQLQSMMGGFFTRFRLRSDALIFSPNLFVGGLEFFSDADIDNELHRLEQQRQALLEAAGFMIGQPDEDLEKGRKKRLSDEEEFRRKIQVIKADETKSIKTQLADQIQAYDDANTRIESLLKQRQDIEEFFNSQRATLEAPAESEERGGLLDMVSIMASARQALAGGEFDRAIDLTKEATEALHQLRKAGEFEGELGRQQSLGFLEQLRRIALEAVDTQRGAAERDQQEAQRMIDGLVARAQFLRKIEIGFDAESAEQSAEVLRQRIQALLDRNPIIAPVVVQPAGETKADKRADELLRDVPGFAGGGPIEGPGTGTSDSILARLSDGEYVVRRDAVSFYGHPFIDAINRMKLPRFADGGMAMTDSGIHSPARGIQQMGYSIPAPGGGLTGALDQIGGDRGGTPVHIHLDGQEFVTQTSEDVATAIQRTFGREALKRGRRRK